MTATDLCRLASAAFPGLTFQPIDVGHGPIAMSTQLSVRRLVQEYAVTVRGQRSDYTGLGDTIESAHADALAVRAEYEPEAEHVSTAQGALDL